jgi:hypothetical protein
MLQQAGAPLGAGIGHVRSLGQNSAAIPVPHLYLQDLGYNTIPSGLLRVGDFFDLSGF